MRKKRRFFFGLARAARSTRRRAFEHFQCSNALTATYKRNGTTCLLAALSVHHGEVTAKCVDSANSQEFLKFLKHLYRKNPGKDLHVIVDNLATHKQADVKSWVASKKRIHMHFTPTYASWLNQIEIWFNIFTRDVLRGGVCPASRHLLDRSWSTLRTTINFGQSPFAGHILANRSPHKGVLIFRTQH